MVLPPACMYGGSQQRIMGIGRIAAYLSGSPRASLNSVLEGPGRAGAGSGMLPPAHQAQAPGTSFSLSPSQSVPCTHLRQFLTSSWLSWEHQTPGLKWINSHPNHKPGKTAQSRGGPGLLLVGQEDASSMVHPKQCSALCRPSRALPEVSSLWKEGSEVRSSPRHVYPWFQHPGLQSH